MDNSEIANKIIDEINQTSERLIKNRFEVFVLIKNSISNNDSELFGNLLFTSKYVKGLKSVLSRGPINGNEYTEKMFNEFTLNLEKVIEQLKKSLNSSENPEKKIFDDKYFGMDHQSISNLMDLIDDLSMCKEFMNKNKIPELQKKS